MQPTNAIERAIVGVTNYGSYGVELFFILSGFLITGILYDARNQPHYIRNFYMRRALRLLPALVVLAITCDFATVIVARLYWPPEAFVPESPEAASTVQTPLEKAFVQVIKPARLTESMARLVEAPNPSQGQSTKQQRVRTAFISLAQSMSPNTRPVSPQGIVRYYVACVMRECCRHMTICPSSL
jgi:hypothetical protein